MPGALLVLQEDDDDDADDDDDDAHDAAVGGGGSGGDSANQDPKASPGPSISDSGFFPCPQAAPTHLRVVSSTSCGQSCTRKT